MKTDKQAVGMNVGSASIVMIFAVLCLTVFSTLSFVTANHERKLAEKSALAVQQYYQADWQCEALYEQIEQRLQDGAQVEALQSLDETITIVQQGANYDITYGASIDEEQRLQVCLTVLPDRSIVTKQWKVVAAQQWEYNDEIAVWDGE